MNHNQIKPLSIVFTLSCLITVNPGEQHFYLCANDESYQDTSIISNTFHIKVQFIIQSSFPLCWLIKSPHWIASFELMKQLQSYSSHLLRYLLTSIRITYQIYFLCFCVNLSLEPSHIFSRIKCQSDFFNVHTRMRQQKRPTVNLILILLLLFCCKTHFLCINNILYQVLVPVIGL